MKHLKSLFFENIILIFIILAVFVGLENYSTRVVKADGFEDWKFELSGNTGGNFTNGIDISDGAAGYLGRDSEKGKGDVWNVILNRYKILIVGVNGLAILTLILIAVFLFTKLSASAADPRARAETTKWIGFLLVAAGLLGSVTIIFSYSYGVFRS